MSTQPDRLLTPEEYLAIERAAETKSEYFAGEMFALAGASRRHNRIVANLIIELGNQLEAGPCEVYPSDMRVKVAESGLYTYPNVLVVRGEPELEDDDILLNPRLILEVLSPSKEAYDRGRKFEHYRRIPSLAEYLLVAQDSHRIEQYTRQDGERWLLTEVRGPNGVVRCETVACELNCARVYRNAF
ncbi:Uma2 family endonuclease [soil metagenome]